MTKLEGSQIQDFGKIRSSSADNQLGTQRQNYRTLWGWIIISPCKCKRTTPDFLVPANFDTFLAHLAEIWDSDFGHLDLFLFFWNFKYIFLSSRYIDSGHFCGNLCCRPKAGCIPTKRSLLNSYSKLDL